jgi:cell division protein ZipA
MESISVLLIVVGAVIIGIVLLLRWGMRRRGFDETPIAPHGDDDAGTERQEFDPLFAVETKVSEVSDRALASVGRIVAERGEPRAASLPDGQPGADDHAQAAAPRPTPSGRRPPRVAEDPHRVVVLNVMAGPDRAFPGRAVHQALEKSGFEYGEWQIFHYYSPLRGDEPPLFSLANMVKPGSFDLEHMDGMNIPGLSLFMVPPGGEDDIVTFDTMLANARQLAEALGGEVRDARRSVLTRQAIGQLREQLNEWRHKAQAAQH